MSRSREDMHTRSRIIAGIVVKHYAGKEEKGSLRSNSATTRIMTDSQAAVQMKEWRPVKPAHKLLKKKHVK